MSKVEMAALYVALVGGLVAIYLPVRCLRIARDRRRAASSAVHGQSMPAGFRRAN